MHYFSTAIYKYIKKKKVLSRKQFASHEITNAHCIRGKTLCSFNSYQAVPILMSVSNFTFIPMCI